MGQTEIWSRLDLPKIYGESIEKAPIRFKRMGAINVEG